MRTAAYAVRYAAAGWRSFPIMPGKKNPVYSGWQAGATSDEKMIRQYWPDTADRNIAVVCGEHFDAWDIEAPHLPKVEAWLNEHSLAFPDAPLARTGRGGIHVLTAPTGVGGSRYLYLDGVHIGELKSVGGYILVAPSVTDGLYQWLNVPEGFAVPEAPQWMLDRLERPGGSVHRFTTRISSVEEGVRHLTALTAALRECGEGRRNNYLYWAMRRALEEGIPAKVASTAMLEVAIEIGLETEEAKKTLRSAYNAEGQAA